MLENHFYSWEIEEFPINVDYGEGFEQELDGEKYISVGDYTKDGYREANMSISSYNGISIGAQHYYCAIKIGVDIQEVSTKNWVFRPGLTIPSKYKSLNLELKRPIEKWELAQEVYDPRYYKEDSLVHGFYTEKEIIILFKEIAPKIFKGKWKIRCDYWNEENETIIIDN